LEILLLPRLTAKRTVLKDAFGIVFRAVRGTKPRILIELTTKRVESQDEGESYIPPDRAAQRKLFLAMLESGEARNMSEIARIRGVSRAWVSKVMRG